MDKDKNLKGILNNFLKNIEKDMQIEQVILFGSRTGNQTDESSDVDLIVVSKEFEGKDHFERATKMYDYWDTETPVDFLCYTPREFNELKDQVTIVREAVKTGVTIK